MRKSILKYGILAGGINITLGLTNWFTVAQTFGQIVSQTLGYFSIVLALMCVPLGIMYFRDKRNNGVLSFSQGFRVGFGITFIASVITFFYTFLFFVFAGERFEEWGREGLSESELTAYELRMEQTPDLVFTPWFQALVLFLVVLIVGLIINLISTLILKTNQPKNNSKWI